VASLVAPIGYLAGLLLLAAVIGRRRLIRRERLVARAAPIDLDGLPVARSAPAGEPAVVDDEATRPRWLRPSLRAERYGMDVGQHRVLPAAVLRAPSHPRTTLTFGSVPDDLDDRRTITAQAANLFGEPGDGGGQPLLRLERGDEVAILDRDEGWLNVLTPTGVAGWLPAADLEARPVIAIAAPDAPLDLADLLAAGGSRRRGTPHVPDAPEVSDAPEAAPTTVQRPRRPRKPRLTDTGPS